MPLFRLLLAVTVLAVIAAELLKHLPSWAITTFGYMWLAVLVAAAYDGWRDTRRDMAARVESERYGLRRL